MKHRNGREFFDVPETVCPVCKALADTVTEASAGMLGGRAPEPHDITICTACHSVLEFTDDMKQKVLTKEEFEALPADVQLDIVEGVTLSQRMEDFKNMLRNQEEDGEE